MFITQNIKTQLRFNSLPNISHEHHQSLSVMCTVLQWHKPISGEEPSANALWESHFLALHEFWCVFPSCSRKLKLRIHFYYKYDKNCILSFVQFFLTPTEIPLAYLYYEGRSIRRFNLEYTSTTSNASTCQVPLEAHSIIYLYCKYLYCKYIYSWEATVHS